MNLKRTLSAGQLSMIAIGGAIGTGLFLASGTTIANAGPGGALLAYAIMGLMVYFLMTSLGEMSAFNPSAGSFYSYAARYVDPALGFALGCNYWYNWAITVAVEIAAVGLVMKFWFPHVPSTYWSGLCLVWLVGQNAISARTFGSAEYVLSLIKVIVIVVFIGLGAWFILGLGHAKAVGLHNWTIAGAPFHQGILGIASAFLVVGFSFQGTELIGIAAGEAENPKASIPRAVKQVFWRILLFYILVMAIIGSLLPYTSSQLMSDSVTTSPFTLVFTQAGFKYMADIMNGVILIAILSAGNSGMYASTRMLCYLARQGHVPRYLGHINARGIPMNALLVTAAVGLLAFLCSIYGDGVVYMWLLNASSLSGFIAWLGIAISHYRFRRAYLYQGGQLSDLPYVAKGYPWAPLLAMALCLIVILGQGFVGDDAKVSLTGLLVTYIGVPIFLGLWLGYKWRHKTRLIPLAACDLSRESRM